MNKTLRAFVLPLALFFTIFTVTAPARAVLPLIAGGVALITEGSTAANGLAALTVGVVAGMIYLGNSQSGAGNEAGSFMEIPLGTSRDRSLSTPANYTPATSNDSQPTPPGSSTPIMQWPIMSSSGTVTGYASSLLAAGQASITWFCSLTASNCINLSVSGTDTVTAYNTDPDHQSWKTGYLPHSYRCEAGYTVSGTSCVLSDASAVMKPADGRCQILMNVSGFVIDPQDPECSGLAAQTGTTVTPSSITSNKPGWLSNGRVQINADGSRTITYSTSNTTNNTTTITTINMVPAAGGQTATVSGSSVVTVAGTGTAAGTIPASPTIDFPDDYNREVTQGQIKTGIETLHGDLDSSAFAQPTVDGAASLAAAENKKITDELNTSVASYDNFKLLDWSTWIPVFPASSCSPFTGNVMGRTVSIDLCPKVAMLNELIGWLLAVYATWSVVMMAFRKD